MTAQVSTPGFLRLVLPGSWVNVPLEDPEVTKAFAQRIVRDQVGRDDRLARARRDAVQQVCELADKARSTGAHTLALALEIAPGIPFAASMVGRDVDWPDVAGAAPEGGAPEGGAPEGGGPTTTPDGGVPESVAHDDAPDAAARLAAAFPGSELRDLPAGVGARQVETGVLRGQEEETTSLSVLYRIPRPDADRLLALRFTAPDLGRPEIIGQLFDAIAGSVEFTRERVFSAED